MTHAVGVEDVKMQIITGLSSNLKRLCCNDLYAYHIHAIAMRPTRHCTSHCQVSPFAMGLYGQKSVMQRKGDWTYQDSDRHCASHSSVGPFAMRLYSQNQLCNARAIGPIGQWPSMYQSLPGGSFRHGIMQPNISYATQKWLKNPLKGNFLRLCSEFIRLFANLGIKFAPLS